MGLKALSFLCLFLLMGCGKFTKVEDPKLSKAITSEVATVKNFSWISEPTEQQPGSFKIEFKQAPQRVSTYTLMKCCGSQKKIVLTSLSKTVFESESFFRPKGEYVLYLQLDSNLKDEAITEFTIR